MATTLEGIDYIRGRLAAGDTREQITAALVTGGWHPDDITEAFAAVDQVPHAPTNGVTPLASQEVTRIVPAQETLNETPRETPVVTQIKPIEPVETAPTPMITSMPSSTEMSKTTPVDLNLDLGGSKPPAARMHSLRWMLWGIVVLIILGLLAVGDYALASGKLNSIVQSIEAHAQHYLPFLSLSHPPYDETAVLSGAARGLLQIQTSAWDVSMHLFTEARSADAKPIPLSTSTTTEIDALRLITAIVPSDFDATLDVSGASQKIGTSTNARATVSFDLTSEDLTASLAAQFEKVGDNFYGIITKIPGLFGDISAIKNQWVAVTPQDEKTFGGQLATFSMTTPLQLNTTQQKAQQDLEKLLGIEEKDHVLSSSAPKLVSLNGQSLYEYDLSPNAAAVPTFYSDAMQAFASDASSTIHFDQAALSYLQSADGMQLTQYLASNLTISIWADQSGIPHKFELSLRVVPTDDVAKLTGKQVRLVTDLTLSDINQPISITAPTSTISADAAYQMVTGKTLEQSLQEERDNERIDNLSSIQFMLSDYHAANHNYPVSLTVLQSYSSTTIPQDPLDKTDYFYTASNASYTLGADLEATSSVDVQFDQGKLLPASCSGANNGRFCYQVKPIPTKTTLKVPIQIVTK
ncbi:MAG TPA: hypothetical protein VMU13_03880 [Candidatus Paceibacterota bacterium]|nr:hypothetical protein [Candidatus Paceibacterota bacterium]